MELALTGCFCLRLLWQEDHVLISICCSSTIHLHAHPQGKHSTHYANRSDPCRKATAFSVRSDGAYTAAYTLRQSWTWLICNAYIGAGTDSQDTRYLWNTMRYHPQEGTRCFWLIPFWGFIVLIEALTSASAIGSSERRRRCFTIKCLMTFVWHFLEACPGFIHYMFSLAYFPNFVWRNLAKNRTKEKSFTLSPMALNLKLLPVSFGVNMCETTSSHVQYVDDVWCMFSHFGQALQTRKNATQSSQEHWQNQTDLACAFQNHSKTVYMHAHPQENIRHVARRKLTLVAKPLHSRCGLLLVSCPISDTIGHNFANGVWSGQKLRAHGTCERTLSKRHPMLFIPFWGFIVLIEALTSSSAIGSSKRRRRCFTIKCLISGRKDPATKDIWAACLAPRGHWHRHNLGETWACPRFRSLVRAFPWLFFPANILDSWVSFQGTISNLCALCMSALLG